MIVEIDGLFYEIIEKGKDIIVKLVHNGENLNEIHNKQIEKEKNGRQSK